MRKTWFWMGLVLAALVGVGGLGHRAHAGMAVGQETGEQVIMATVNGENITLGDVFRVLQQSGKNELLKRALKSAVIEKLYLQEAARLGYHPQDISASEIDAAMKERVDMVEKQLGQKAAETLTTLLMDPTNNAKVREDTIRQLLVKKVFEKRREEASAVVTPTAEEIDQFVQQFGKEVVALHLRRVLLPTKKAAETARKKIKNGLAFEELVKKEGLEDAAKAAGGDDGWKTPKEIGPVYAMFIKNLKDGEVSEPMKAQKGRYALVQVVARRLARDNMPQLIEVAKNAVRGQHAVQSVSGWTKKITQDANITVPFAPLAFPLED